MQVHCQILQCKQELLLSQESGPNIKTPKLQHLQESDILVKLPKSTYLLKDIAAIKRLAQQWSSMFKDFSKV
jgi:hypothetical protein